MMTFRPVLLVTVACLILSAWACEPEQYHSGCKIIGASCKCGWGCKTEYIYKTRRACRNALKAAPLVAPTPSPAAPAPAPAQRATNICSGAPRPCARGICLQTSNDYGFTCKCEGTGFYGQRCEKACPAAPIRDIVFAHECIII